MRSQKIQIQMLFRRIFILLSAFGLLASKCVREPKGDRVQLFPQATAFSFRGLEIIRYPAPSELVVMDVIFKGGVENYPKQKAGIELLAIQTAVNGGTKTKDAVAFQRALQFCGASLETSFEMDYSRIRLTCLKRKFRCAFALLSEALMEPAFDAESFKVIRAQGVLDADAAAKDVIRMSGRKARELAFARSPYERHPEGTPESLNSLDLDEVKAYWEKFLLRKCNMFLVVAGELGEEAIVDRLLEGIDALPTGECDSLLLLSRQNFFPSKVHFESTADPGSALYGLLPAPNGDWKAAVNMDLAMTMLESRLSKALIQETELAYTVYAGLQKGRQHYNVVYINGNRPNQSAEKFVSLVRSVRTEGFGEAELEKAKARVRIRSLLELDNPVRIADQIAISAAEGRWSLFREYPGQVQVAELEQVNTTFRNFCNRITWVAAGDTSLLRRSVFQQSLMSN